MPETTPAVSTVAIPPLADQVPPATEGTKVVFDPIQMADVPDIETAVGVGLTVNVIVLKHPVVAVKVIIEVPADTPLTTPVADPMVATPVFELTHVPETEFVSVVDDPAQTELEPDGTDGTGFTVTVVVYTVDGLQPEPVLLTVSEYVPVTVGVAVGF